MSFALFPNLPARAGMKAAALLLFMALWGAGSPCLADADAGRGLVLEGQTLRATLQGKSTVLRRGDFYGYGWLDDHRVFIAYQNEDFSEAVVNAEVVDLRNGSTFGLGTIMEAHGESTFAVNAHTRQVAFNAFGDRATNGTLSTVVRLMTFDRDGSAHRVETIRDNIDCARVSWVDDHTLEATLNDAAGTRVRIPVPPARGK